MKTTNEQRLAWYRQGLEAVERMGQGACTCVRLHDECLSFREALYKLHYKDGNGIYRYAHSSTLLPELHVMRTTDIYNTSWFNTHEERVAALKAVIEILENETD